MGEITEIRAYPPQAHSTGPFLTAIEMKGSASTFLIQDAAGREICAVPADQHGLTKGVQASNALLFGASPQLARRLWEACEALDAEADEHHANLNPERARELEAIAKAGREALRAGGIRP